MRKDINSNTSPDNSNINNMIKRIDKDIHMEIEGEEDKVTIMNKTIKKADPIREFREIIKTKAITMKKSPMVEVKEIELKRTTIGMMDLSIHKGIMMRIIHMILKL